MSGIEGKVVAITGASSGIGEATARLLARRGARVLLGARRIGRLNALANEIVEAGGCARYQALDVTRRASMQSFIDEATAAFGRIDVIVNGVNARGVLHGIATGLPRMRAQGGGGQFVCCASRFGAQVISDRLRKEVGGDIRVTMISPDLAEPEPAERIPDAMARAIAFAIEQPDVETSETPALVDS